MSFGQRMKQIRTELGLTQKDFGEQIGLLWHKIKDIEAEKLKLTPLIAETIEQKYSINGWWLLTGKGSKSIENNIEEKRIFFIPAINTDLDYIILDKKLYAFFADNPTLKAFKMTDNTMETYISKDAWIIIDTSVHNFTDIGYYLIEENERKTIRYITKNKDTLELHSHNPKLTQTRNKDEVKILGIELHIIR